MQLIDIIILALLLAAASTVTLALYTMAELVKSLRDDHRQSKTNAQRLTSSGAINLS